MLVCLKGKAMNNIFPKVSIIIPVYKVEEYIEDCILSVMSQTFLGGLECIIVDDCTPDNSIALIQKLIKDYKGNIQFKIVHHKENKGLSSARNTGLKYAKGEYVYFLDSDDELYPTCIQDLALPLSKKKYDFVIGDYSVKGDIIFEIPKLLLETGEVLDTENIVSSYEYSNDAQESNEEANENREENAQNNDTNSYNEEYIYENNNAEDEDTESEGNEEDTAEDTEENNDEKVTDEDNNDDQIESKKDDSDTLEDTQGPEDTLDTNIEQINTQARDDNINNA